MAGIGFKYVQRGLNIFDFTVVQGKTFILPYTATGEEITSISSARWVVRSNVDNSVLFEMSTSNSRAVIIGKTVTYTMTSSEMAAVSAPFFGRYENEIVTNLGTLQALKGKFTVESEDVY